MVSIVTISFFFFFVHNHYVDILWVHMLLLVIASLFFSLQVMDMLVVFAAVLVEIAYEVDKDRLPELEACTFVIIFRLIRIPQACNSKFSLHQNSLLFCRVIFFLALAFFFFNFSFIIYI